jgi:hypothetical protein
MFLGIRKKYWWFLLATLALTGLLVFANLSPVFALRSTEIHGPLAEMLVPVSYDWLQEGVNLFQLDLKRSARQALLLDEIGNVRLVLHPPNGLTAEVNRFEPVALLVTDKLYAIDRHCRAIPFDTTWRNIDLPALTGLPPGKMFEAPRDFRIVEVVAGLLQIKTDLPELYRRLAEIDFSDPVHLTIYLTTGAERYLAVSRDLASQLVKLHAISDKVTRSDSACYNLQYTDMVVKQ